uniref:Uncharacterized protein n=1 Tax=Magallana gigas TaxID=29159 RepID=A0A8W8MCW3_MAGGI
MKTVSDIWVVVVLVTNGIEKQGTVQSVKLDTQALIAVGNASIQVMDGNAYWSVTVQKNIAVFLLDVW